nr:isoform 2 of rab gdp dissociation inhibitor beta [Quercus suber]
MSKDTSSYPLIDPTNFDLIVLGTRLPESVIASTNGKTVLYLDPNPFYGSDYTSLSLHDDSFLISHSAPPHSPPSAPSDGHDFIPTTLTAHPLFCP